MKKTLLTLIIAFISCSYSHAQWSANTSNNYNPNTIYNTVAGVNVGINTAYPADALHVNGNLRANRIVVGGPSSLYINFANSANITGNTGAFANFSNGVVQSDVTTAVGYYSVLQISPTTALTNLTHFWASQGTPLTGSNGSIVSQYGFNVSANLIGATNNYGFYSAIPTGTGRWNLYMAGTADNYLRGKVGIGTMTPELSAHITGGSGFPVTTGTSQTGVLRLQDGASNGVLDFGIKGSYGAALQVTNRSDLSLAYPLYLNPNGGSVGIGVTNAPIGYKLAVNGNVIATEVTVKLYANWPDYVFKKNYRLPTLSEVKTYIDKNHHLPDMPSEKEVADNGLNLGEMNKVLTKKIEELTLYLIQQQKINQSLQKQINNLAKKQK